MSEQADDWKGRYVERDAEGKIKGSYGVPQPGYAEEAVAENDPELIAFELRAATMTVPAIGAMKLAPTAEEFDALKARVAELFAAIGKPAPAA